MCEDMAGLSRGSITWNITNRKFVGEPCVCLSIKINGKEFVSISSLIQKKYKNAEDLLYDVSVAQDYLSEKVQVILGTYGLVNLVQNIGMKDLRFVYVTDSTITDERPGIEIGSVSVN